jgi:hypothetical protein
MVSEVKIEIGGVSRPPAYEAFKSQKSRRTDRRILPELNQAEKSVLDSLGSLRSRRWYRRAMDEFSDWYCSEPRLALKPGRGTRTLVR